MASGAVGAVRVRARLRPVCPRADAEARGELESARLEYLTAAGEDDDNVEIWTRIGAVELQRSAARTTSNT